MKYTTNPTRPGALRPVEIITDRAKRYRAVKNVAPGHKRCYLCGNPKTRDVEHIDGHEKNDNPENLARACRSCNTVKGRAFKAQKAGTRTRQYNPAKPGRRRNASAGAKGAQSLGQYLTAVMVLKGQSDAMDLQAAIDMMHNTPAADRSSFAQEIWNRRGRRAAEVPF